MFNLSEEDLRHPIVSFADGTSSANSELNKRGQFMVSIDPVYQFSRQDLERRLHEVIAHSENYLENLPLHQQKEMKEIAESRAGATKVFLEDIEPGIHEQRYINASLPGPLSLNDLSFRIGLCSHFLLLYDNEGLTFHLSSITEMLRICEEVRIYPTINLNGQPSEVLNDVINHFSSDYQVQLESVEYGFQDMGKQMLRISR